MKNILRTLIYIGLLSPMSVLAHGPEDLVNESYTKNVYTDSLNNELPYRLLSPETINEGEKYPLILFLHGAGERGNDNEKQLLHGGALFTNPINEDIYPAFVVFPQCKDHTWTNKFDERTFMPGSPTPEESNSERMVMALLDELIANNPIDTNRIYIIGISMGGVATFDLVCRYPEKFAAAVPICGAINPERLAKAKDVPFFIFQGADDKVVPILAGREAYEALKAVGADVKYKEYYGAGHEETWTDAFNNPDLLKWLFSKNRAAE